MNTKMSRDSRFFVSLSIGAIAAIGSLVSTAHAQIGSGWVEFFPTSFLDVQSGGDHTHYDLADHLQVDGVEYSYDSASKVETFKLLSNESNRLERQADEHYSSGARQMQGDL